MNFTSEDIVNDLYWILTSTTSLPDLYTKRCGGFRNEKEIEELLHEKGYQQIDGGQLIFVKKNENSEMNKIFYYTVSNDNITNYGNLYTQLSQMDEIERLFFIKVHSDEWGRTDIKVKNTKGQVSTRSILKPNFSVHEFSNGEWRYSSFDEIKNEMSAKRESVCKVKDPATLDYMREWNTDELSKIYCNRYVLDVELNLFKKNMMDFDSMIINEGNYIAIESKEKDPIGKWVKSIDANGMEEETIENDTSKWAFGWDTRRYAWYNYLKTRTGLDTWYLVREVEHQRRRNLVGWKKISIDDFSKCSVWHFERQSSRGSTIESTYDAFEDF
jgi:hypothetical protein